MNNKKLSTDLVHALDNASKILDGTDGDTITVAHLFLGILNNDFITKKIISNIGNTGYYKILNGVCQEIKNNNNDSIDAQKFINNIKTSPEGHSINSIDALNRIIKSKFNIIDKWVSGLDLEFLKEKRLSVVSRPNKTAKDSSTESWKEADEQKEVGLLEKWCVNLNNKHKENGFDGVFSREREIVRIENILCRRKKNNPVLVGEAGVGKTAIIEGLVQKIVSGEASDQLSNKIIYSTTAGELTAGTRFRGDLEEKIEGIIAELEADNNKILFIDEIHTVMKKSSDIADLIKPALSGKKINCIGATTEKEWRKYFSKDGAMSRRMTIVDVNEPNINETIEIVTKSKKMIEGFHSISIKNSLINEATLMADKWIQDNKFPDKVFDIVDEACVLAKMRGVQSISQKDIETSVHNLTRGKSSGTGLTVKNLGGLQSRLIKHIKGQKDIIDDVSGFIRVSETGLGYKDKPKGVFLFRGSSGVGKTALSKQISEELKMNLIKIDMGEYSESHSISKIIGSPPGYVGHEDGGGITEQVQKNPHSIIILDEIEKAHKSVHNILLGVFDEGYLSDGSGRKIDFTNTYIIMTSNVAVDEANKLEIGFTGGDGKPLIAKEIKKVFSREFINRITYVANFKNLDNSILGKILSEKIISLTKQVKEKGVDLIIDGKCTKNIIKQAQDEKMGARPIERIIHNKLKPIISDFIIAKDGTKLEITWENNKYIKI